MMAKQVRAVTMSLVFAGAAALLCGCGGARGVLEGAGAGGGGGGPVPGDKTGPTITNAKATPPGGFRWTGGDVILEAEATDVSGVQSVTAKVRREKTGDETDVTLTKTTGDHYRNTYTAPANLNNDNTAEQYTVTLTAKDGAGNESTATVTFEVPPATPPQTPPPNL